MANLAAEERSFITSITKETWISGGRVHTHLGSGERQEAGRQTGKTYSFGLTPDDWRVKGGRKCLFFAGRGPLSTGEGQEAGGEQSLRTSLLGRRGKGQLLKSGFVREANAQQDIE